MYKVIIGFLAAATTAIFLPQITVSDGETQPHQRRVERRGDHSSFDDNRSGFGDDDEQAPAADRGSDEPIPAGTSEHTTLGAQLVDTTPNSTDSGTAVYRTWTVHGTTDAEVKLYIRGAAPNTTLTATVADVNGNVIATIGTVTTDANGNAHEEFATDVDPWDTDAIALPPDFPTLTLGESITVGTLGGDLSTTLPPPWHRHGTVLRAQLIDSSANSADSGTAVYRNWTFQGTTNSEVKLHIHGAAPNTTLQATVADVNGNVIATIGTITTNANGNAHEEFATAVDPWDPDVIALPPDFPTLTLGESITVGTLGGTLSAPTVRDSDEGRDKHRGPG